MMALGNPPLRTVRMRPRHFLRQSIATGLALAAISAAAPAHAKEKAKEEKPDLPRLGLDLAEPQLRSAPPADPFVISQATYKKYVLDCLGYLLIPMNLGIHEREDPGEGQSNFVLHSPPLIPQDYGDFEYTAVIPDPWVQLNFTYGNSVVAGTVIL